MAGMEIRIRPAEADDAPHIMKMTQELAAYEKISHLLTLTEEALLRDGFGESPWFHCVVAELPESERSEKGTPFAGYALFARSYSSWTGRTLHLEDIYVSPQVRGRGIGKKLMKRVARFPLLATTRHGYGINVRTALCQTGPVGTEALTLGCSQIHLSVLKWNAPAVCLYRSLGAHNLTEDLSYQAMSFNMEALQSMAQEEEPR